MTPEMLFVLAIIAAIGTSATGIIVGVVSLVVSKKSAADSATAKTDAETAKTSAATTTDVVTQKTDETLALIKGLSDQLAETLKQQNGDLRTNVTTLNEIVSNQAQQLTQIVKNNAVIRDENAQFRADIDHYKQLVDDLQANVTSINTERAQEKSYIKVLEKTIADLKDEQDKKIQEYQRLLADQGETLSTTKDELKNRLQEIEDLRLQIAEIGDLRERVEALEKAVKTMTEEREALNKRIDELTAERDAAISRAETAERERDAARSALARLQESTDKLDTQELESLVQKPPAVVEMPNLTGGTPNA